MSKYLKEFINYFDHCYVLSIPRAKDRQANIIKQFNDCPFEFSMGMDGIKEDRNELIKNGVFDEKCAKKRDSHNRTLSIGDIACSWGQRNIYKKILQNGYKNTIIFEDDVIVNFDALKMIEKALDKVPSDADLIYWGWESILMPPKQRILSNIYHKSKLLIAKLLPNRNGFSLHNFSVTDFEMINNIYTRKYNEVFYRSGAHYCTHAYSVNEKAAEILFEMQTPIKYAADHLLINAILHRKIRAYSVIQKLFLQDNQTVNPMLFQYTKR